MTLHEMNTHCLLLHDIIQMSRPRSAAAAAAVGVSVIPRPREPWLAVVVAAAVIPGAMKVCYTPRCCALLHFDIIKCLTIS